ncbi:hypothetical protein LX16_4948 [Stackebrandtia albiflava]|uniref:Trypsin-co-occurring domain-containing protein n=1 Tax=Stackebrandtia albiflava TaxID=406432 RepID=A0A562UQ80_9ACTN|nr:hypothetical protein LX16_4948 [Stackebrandtia albiflava]
MLPWRHPVPTYRCESPVREVVPVKIGDTEFLMETVASPSDTYDGLTPISGSLEPESFDRVRDMVAAVAGELTTVWERVKPQEATVEFGVTADVKSGRLTGLLVGGGASASLKITLKWTSIPDGQ